MLRPTCVPARSQTHSNCSSQRFKFKHNMYKLREERDIKPSAFGQLVSATLYERRFGPYFCQPVIGAPTWLCDGWFCGWRASQQGSLLGSLVHHATCDKGPTARAS